jgi:type IV secretory pathway VirB10-like protein
MNTFWLKIAGIAVAVLGVIILISVFSSPKPEPQPQVPEKTFWDQVEEDDKSLRAEPQYKQPAGAVAPAPLTDTNQTAEQVVPVEPTKPQFRELSEIEDIDAEQLFNNALQFRKIGRLPGPSYKIMVDTCRQIIQKYPGSEWAWKAKRMLADIPEHYRDRYKITEEEIDLGDFK